MGARRQSRRPGQHSDLLDNVQLPTGRLPLHRTQPVRRRFQRQRCQPAQSGRTLVNHQSKIDSFYFFIFKIEIIIGWIWLNRLIKGRLNVQFTIFGIQQPLKPIQRRLVRIPALPRCHSHSPDEQILLLGCVDGSVIAWDVTKDTTLTYKSSFVSQFLYLLSLKSGIPSIRNHLENSDRKLMEKFKNSIIMTNERGTEFV